MWIEGAQEEKGIPGNQNKTREKNEKEVVVFKQIQVQKSSS